VAQSIIKLGFIKQVIPITIMEKKFLINIVILLKQSWKKLKHSLVELLDKK
jgi:hypothetical protein